jgi:hypothetical protein
MTATSTPRSELLRLITPGIVASTGPRTHGCE